MSHCRMSYLCGIAEFMLDSKTRTVTCKHGGEDVDTFDVLLMLSEKEDWCIFGAGINTPPRKSNLRRSSPNGL